MIPPCFISGTILYHDLMKGENIPHKVLFELWRDRNFDFYKVKSLLMINMASRYDSGKYDGFFIDELAGAGTNLVYAGVLISVLKEASKKKLDDAGAFKERFLSAMMGLPYHVEDAKFGLERINAIAALAGTVNAAGKQSIADYLIKSLPFLAEEVKRKGIELKGYNDAIAGENCFRHCCARDKK